MNPRVARSFVLAGTLLCVVPTIARAGDQPRLERVLLLPVAGRVSLVLEMTAAPGTVTSRRLSADLLEIDAGPARVEHPQALTAPSGTPLVSSVVVDGSAPGGASMLRARITLQGAYESRVRVQGNRVYVDLSTASAERVQARPAAPERTHARSNDVTVGSDAPAAESQERAELDSALSRFDRLMPFVTSAANAPSEPVLSALTAPLAALMDTVRTLPTTEPLRPSEGLLASAVSAAARAIDPGYRGDRLEQVRQAESFYQQAKAERDALGAAK